MDRNAKLAAARSKLAKFQKAKASTVPAKRPENEAISRGGIADENGPPSVNGNHEAPAPFSMNNFSHSQSQPSNGNNLSALEQVELHATREQLQEQQKRITELEESLKREHEEKENNATNAVQSIQQLQRLLEETKNQNDLLQKTLTDEQSKFNQINFNKDTEISTLKSGKLQAEQLSQQLNDQLNQLQHQVEVYQSQVSQNNSQNVANQHQLSGKVQEQQMTIEILVEEKAELNTRVRQLEELEISLRANLEASLSSDKNNSQNILNLRQENKRLNESNEQLSSQIDEKDATIKKFQQTSSRLKSEVDIISLKEEDNKLMIEQLEAQIKEFQQINATLTEEKNMAEASLMQMSSGSDAVLLERNRLMDIVNELKARVQQQQYQLEEISSERDQYRLQQHATTEKSQAAINGLAEQLDTSVKENETLKEEIAVLREQSISKADDSEIDELTKTILEHEETFKELDSEIKLQTEARHQAEQKVQDVRKEKEELQALVQHEQDRSEAFQRRCTDLEQRQIEYKIMLESSEGDKATISRVLTQNKKLKDEFEELQNQLVLVTNQKADMLQDNDGLRHKLKAAEAAIEESQGVQLDKDQWRDQLESHEQAIKNLRADLDLSQQEVKNTLRENAELRDALKTARSQARSPVSSMISVETMTTFDVSMNGEQGDDSSSYSFVGLSEQGSSQDLGEDLSEMHESEHAIAQPGVFPDDTLANIEPINQTVSEKPEIINRLEAQIETLEKERDELTSQLVEAKQKQLKLMEKTDAAMERPAQEDYSALKSAKEALETKFVDIIQQNASIKDENEKLEALVLQLNAETDTIIEYVSLYRDQRSALARKDKERNEELQALALQRQEVQARVNQLEMLLKSTVQNIRPQVEAAQTISETKKDETSSDAGSTAPEGEIERSEEAPEPLELSETEKGNIDKILTLLDEIRDPFQGQSTPAMIGMEYEGQLMIV